MSSHAQCRRQNKNKVSNVVIKSAGKKKSSKVERDEDGYHFRRGDQSRPPTEMTFEQIQE